MHLHITINVGGSPCLSAHEGYPCVDLSVVLCIVGCGVVAGVFDGRETPECQGEEDEDGHDDAEGGGDFVAHVEVWKICLVECL